MTNIVEANSSKLPLITWNRPDEHCRCGRPAEMGIHCPRCGFRGLYGTRKEATSYYATLDKDNKLRFVDNAIEATLRVESNGLVCKKCNWRFDEVAGWQTCSAPSPRSKVDKQKIAERKQEETAAKIWNVYTEANTRDKKLRVLALLTEQKEARRKSIEFEPPKQKELDSFKKKPQEGEFVKLSFEPLPEAEKEIPIKVPDKSEIKSEGGLTETLNDPKDRMNEDDLSDLSDSTKKEK